MKDSSSDGDTITVSDIVQYFYCPRKVYFLKTLGVPVNVRHKMEYGQEIHEQEKRRMHERKQIYGFDREDIQEIMESLQIEAPDINLRGKIDVALKLKTGEIIPVDTKYTDEETIQLQHRKQLHAYALLLDHELGINVTRGIIYFAQQRHLKVVDISKSDKERMRRDVQRIKAMISSEQLPRGVSISKCAYCEVKKYCLR